MDISWSESLVEQTRSALQTPPMTLDDDLCLKNTNGNFGQIGLSGLVTGILRVTDRRSGETHLYESVDELIAAGWVVD